MERARKKDPAIGGARHAQQADSNLEIRSVAEEQPQQNDHRDRHA
jgi:hypothetical protein